MLLRFQTRKSVLLLDLLRCDLLFQIGRLAGRVRVRPAPLSPSRKSCDRMPCLHDTAAACPSDSDTLIVDSQSSAPNRTQFHRCQDLVDQLLRRLLTSLVPFSSPSEAVLQKLDHGRLLLCILFPFSLSRATLSYADRRELTLASVLRHRCILCSCSFPRQQVPERPFHPASEGPASHESVSTEVDVRGERLRNRWASAEQESCSPEQRNADMRVL